MANAENAKLQYEAGQNVYTMSALADSGDATVFTSSATLFSKKSGYAPDVRPNGLITGGAITPAVSNTNDMVDVAALTCYLAGVKVAVAADTDVSITRGLMTDTHNITSITVKSDGTIEAVSGNDGTEFSETRGAAGGPPLIPVGSIEIGQVRTTSVDAAAVDDAEIVQVVGVHQERYDYPIFEIDYANAEVTFASALPLIHTGGVPKAVYASYADPIFADVQLSSDFVPAETSHSVSSTQVYGSTLGSTSSSLGQASFTAFLNDGIGDALVGLKNAILWFKFFPDRYKSSYMLTQGKLGISRTFPAGDNIQAACTISAESESIEVSI
ncbi:hypothetical protein [Methylobacter marinus]|uniref:hypothetical protein n=1 Tax=Methylobacter marinus TaxID=34058 RepID=UPI0003732A37|nr:hypothetical protein [Methylobacter marinus]